MLNLRLKTLVAAGAVALAGAFGATSASAATTCQFGDSADYGAMMADVYTSLACEGAMDGNDATDTSNIDGLFGIADFDFAGKVDEPGTADGKLTVTYDGGAPSMTGTWSVDDWDGVVAAILVIKGSKMWAAYLIDLSAGTSGGWATWALTTGGGTTPDISHISLYTASDCPPGSLGCFPPTTPVPLPAGFPLLLGGLAAMGYIARRRAKA